METLRAESLLAIERADLLGLVEYAEAMELMRLRAAQRRRGEIPDTLLLLEHPPVVTLGVRAGDDELRLARHELRARGIDYAKTDRGGLATLHAPGQVVGYLICGLPAGRRDLPRFVRALEARLIATLGRFGVEAATDRRNVGVWVSRGEKGRAKIGSLGLAFHEGVTTHGFALNVSNDLSLFGAIRPCGLEGVRMTRLADEVSYGRQEEVTAREFMQRFLEGFSAPAWLPEPLARLQNAWNRREADRAAACFSPEGSFEAPGRDPVRGRDNLTAFFRRFFSRLDVIRFELLESFRPPTDSQGHFLLPYRCSVIGGGDGSPRLMRGLVDVQIDAAGLVERWEESHAANGSHHSF